MAVPTQVSAVTRCPHCGARFRVHPEQVKPHAGLVRCGACRGIFDAVEHLLEGKLPPITTHDDETGDPPRTIVQGVPAVEQLAPAPAPAATPTPPVVTPVSPAPARTVAAAPRAGATVMPAVIERKASPPAAAPEVRVTNLDADTRSPALRAAAGPGSAAAGANASAAAAAPAASAAAASPDTITGDRLAYRWRATPQPATPAMRVVYALLSLLALVVFVAQAAYFFRDEIASRLPATAPALTLACAQLGCRVEPPRRTDALGFVGAELAADPAHKGLLVFTATLRNSGNQAVAYPHLVLSLDGLGGELVTRKVFAPTEFAPATANLARGLDGGAEIEVKLYLDASQANVVGFKVDHAYLQ